MKKTLFFILGVCFVSLSSCTISFDGVMSFDFLDSDKQVVGDTIPYNGKLYVNGKTYQVYNPYKEQGRNQYAGQLHCHSWSYVSYNGVLYKVPITDLRGHVYTVEEMAAMTEQQRNDVVDMVNGEFVAAHKEIGYHFMTITNYDHLADYTKAPTHLPDGFTWDGFIWLYDSFEAAIGHWDGTGQTEDHGAHMVVMNTDIGMDASTVFSALRPQELVDFFTNRGSIVTWAHPSLSADYASPSYVKRVKRGMRFIEVFNGLGYYHSPIPPFFSVILRQNQAEIPSGAIELANPLDVGNGKYKASQIGGGISSQLPTTVGESLVFYYKYGELNYSIWTITRYSNETPYIKAGVELDEAFDALLTQGNYIFGLGVSDYRSIDVRQNSVLKRGCVKVFANELSQKPIIDALLDGNFYICENLDDSLDGVSIVGGEYIVKVGKSGVTVEFVKENNTVLSTIVTTNGNTNASYTINGTEKFVRARIYTSVGNNKTSQMWTQPFFISELVL